MIKNAFEQIKLQGRGKFLLSAQKAHLLIQLKLKTVGGVTAELIERLFEMTPSTKPHGAVIGLASA